MTVTQKKFELVAVDDGFLLTDRKLRHKISDHNVLYGLN